VPHATNHYHFETAVWIAAERHCNGTIGTVLLGPGGELLDVLRDGAGSFAVWDQLHEQLKAQGTSFVFYDPFDEPAYVWVEWNRVSRIAMEGFVGATFVISDFEPLYANERSLDLPETFPETWGVMF
jgi:hypothetical protein